MAVLYVKSKYAPRNKELAKQLTSIKSDNDQPNQLAAFRFVSADSLIVRLKASKKSAPIGNLYFASVVILVEKKKNWSLVEWRDPDSGVSIKGWVFSRYLTKFK